MTNAAGQQVVSLTCDFSGYLPEGGIITWTGPQGVLMGNSNRHNLVSGDGDGQSQSGGGSPGPSVLSTFTISTVEEEDIGNYICQMIGKNSVQLMGIVKLSAFLGKIHVTNS